MSAPGPGVDAVWLQQDVLQYMGFRRQLSCCQCSIALHSTWSWNSRPVFTRYSYLSAGAGTADPSSVDIRTYRLELEQQTRLHSIFLPIGWSWNSRPVFTPYSYLSAGAGTVDPSSLDILTYRLELEQ
jgi:hypothetical protein